ncbi:MAG: hypothetical protein NTY77_15165, partial [Elusimicrobia bacterium]|nr:hypothetical protein [Elusimicrobiota bacterium]
PQPGGSGMGNSATQEGILGRAEANWCIKSAPHCVAKGLRTEFLREAQYLSQGNAEEVEC